MEQGCKMSDYNINFWELILYILVHVDYLDKTVQSEKNIIIRYKFIYLCLIWLQQFTLFASLSQSLGGDVIS